MYNKKVTKETVKERLAEEYRSRPGTFFDEIGALVADFHDYQQSCRKICRGNLFYLWWRISNISF